MKEYTTTELNKMVENCETAEEMDDILRKAGSSLKELRAVNRLQYDDY
jgi:hypothetical protein